MLVKELPVGSFGISQARLQNPTQDLPLFISKERFERKAMGLEVMVYGSKSARNILAQKTLLELSNHRFVLLLTQIFLDSSGQVMVAEMHTGESQLNLFASDLGLDPKTSGDEPTPPRPQRSRAERS